MSSTSPPNTNTPPHSPPVVTAATANDCVSIIGDAEKHYYASNCDVKVLVVLCRSIFQEDGTPLLDESVVPWSSMKPRLSIKPTTEDLRKEVVHRFKSFVSTVTNTNRAPQPSQWTVSKVEDYLKNILIACELDVVLLHWKVLELKVMLEEAALATALRNNTLEKE